MYTAKFTDLNGKVQNAKIFELGWVEAMRTMVDQGAKGLGWAMLEQPESLDELEATSDSDSAETCFALNILENALEWGIGLKAFGYMRALIAQRKTEGNKRRPKLVRIAVNRKGDCFAVVKTETGLVAVL